MSVSITSESMVPVSAFRTQKGLHEFLLHEGMCRKIQAMESERPFGHCAESAPCFLHKLAVEMPNSTPLNLEGRDGQR